jgi:TP901 family phage tail tape measure protein
MATRNADLRVTIDADAAKLERAIASANRSMMRFQSQLRSTDLQAAQLDQIINQQRADATRRVGQAMVGFGVAVAAGLGMAVKSAIDWESAWTGVLKTVEGTPEQLAKVEKGLRDLATTLPSSHREIAAVAEAAGQLGIATDDVVEFTRVMIDLGETTNLTAEEAATSIAQMMNVMQTAPEDVGRLGAALVELGNNGASTERDIIQMAQRISGAGAIINLSEADVLAFANALASVGIEAEAGGTALSTAMVKMASAVAEGGESVAEFADVAGMSAAQFTRAFETDPARAIQAFVEGLARIDASGGNVFATLSDLELGQIRVRDSLLRLSGAGDLLGQSLDDGARAWEENTALIDEAAKRYDTAEAKIQIAKNAVVEFAIDMGSVLLPAIASMAEGVASVAQFFADLPGPVQAVATVFALLLGAAALLGGGFLLLAPKIVAARTAMLLLARTAPVMYGALAYSGQFLGVIGGLLAVAAAIEFIGSRAGNLRPKVGEATQALLELRDGVSNDLINRLVEAQQILDDTPDILGRFSLSLTTMSGTVRAASNDLQHGFESVDSALEGLVTSGNAEEADRTFRALSDAWVAGGRDIDDLNARLPRYQDALAQVAVDQQLTTESVDPLQDALGDLATRFGLTGDDAAKAAEDMLKAWEDAGGEFVGVLGAYTTALESKEAKERTAAEKTAESTEDATDSWEDYVGDVKLTVDEYIAELERMVENQTNWRDNLIQLAGRASEGLLNHLISLGPAGADLVALFASMTDKELQEAEGLWMNSTDAAVRGGIIDPLLDADPILRQIAADHGKNVADKLREYMLKHGPDVHAAAKALGIQIDKGVRDGEKRTIPINLTGKQQALEGIQDIKRAIDRLPSGKKITITATGDIRVGGGTALRAEGGPVEAGEPYIVGERGPELFVPRRGGEIVPNHKLAMGGPVSKVNIHAREDIDAADWNDMVSGVARRVGNAAGAVPGKVLPTGSYRIGRGPAGHGYNARDLPAPIGTPVYAAASGIVSRAARLATSYGIHAAISHAGWRSLYAHMSQMYVRTGQQVSRGQQIGRVGSTGNSTGPHLHLEPDNPRLYDTGGKWRHGQLGLNTSGGTEYVLSPQQSRTFDRFVSVMERPRGGDGAQAVDQFALARMVGDAVGRSIDGATLVMDDRGRGQLIARNSDLYARAG